MPGIRFAEWLLRRTTTAENASTQLGDLLELAQTRGQAWFWRNLLATTAHAALRPTLAFLAAFAFSKLVEYLWNHGLFGNHPDLNSFDTTGAVFLVPLTLLPVYALIRHGLRDTFAIQSAAFALILALTTALILALNPHPELLWIEPALIVLTIATIRLGRRFPTIRPLAQLSSALTINCIGIFICLVGISLLTMGISALFHIDMLTYNVMTALATHPYGDLLNVAICLLMIRTSNRLRFSTPLTTNHSRLITNH